MRVWEDNTAKQATDNVPASHSEAGDGTLSRDRLPLVGSGRYIGSISSTSGEAGGKNLRYFNTLAAMIAGTTPPQPALRGDNCSGDLENSALARLASSQETAVSGDGGGNASGSRMTCGKSAASSASSAGVNVAPTGVRSQRVFGFGAARSSMAVATESTAGGAGVNSQWAARAENLLWVASTEMGEGLFCHPQICIRQRHAVMHISACRCLRTTLPALSFQRITPAFSSADDLRNPYFAITQIFGNVLNSGAAALVAPQRNLPYLKG